MESKIDELERQLKEAKEERFEFEKKFREADIPGGLKLPFVLTEDDLHLVGESRDHVNPAWLVKMSRNVMISSFKEQRTLKGVCN